MSIEVEKKIEGVVVCTNRVVIMKENIPFFREFSIVSIRYRVAVDPVV